MREKSGPFENLKKMMKARPRRRDARRPSRSRSNEGTYPTEMPCFAMVWFASWNRCEACRSALEGMHPTFRHVPPSVPRPSTQVTFSPSCAPLMAATYPPGPPPITTTSCCSPAAYQRAPRARRGEANLAARRVATRALIVGSRRGRESAPASESETTTRRPFRDLRNSGFACAWKSHDLYDTASLSRRSRVSLARPPRHRRLPRADPPRAARR